MTFLGAGPESMTLIAEALADARDLGACKPGVVDDVRATFTDPYFVREDSLLGR